MSYRIADLGFDIPGLDPDERLLLLGYLRRTYGNGRCPIRYMPYAEALLPADRWERAHAGLITRKFIDPMFRFDTHSGEKRCIGLMVDLDLLIALADGNPDVDDVPRPERGDR